MTWTQSLVVFATMLQGQVGTNDYFHDFRGGAPMPPWLALSGPDADEVVTLEAAGLRIKLPANGKQTRGWGVLARFTLSGDFEVTGTYEFVTVNPPTKGSGVGVALNLAPNAQRIKFAKVGRFLRLKEGSVNVAETWMKEPPKIYKVQTVPTEARGGKLRIQRKGSELHYLVADAPGDAFQEIYAAEFGSEDLTDIVFLANNNSSPTTADVRLLDFRIHSGKILPTPALDKARVGLAAAELLGLVLTVLVAGLAGAWLFLRRRRATQARSTSTTAGRMQNTPAPAAPTVLIACPSCGRSLKAKADLAGKKVKCTQCGALVLVPVSQADVS